MNNASNANAPVTSPQGAAQLEVTEHAPPTVLVTVDLASSAVGLGAATAPAAAGVSEPQAEGEPALPYSADEAAWLFGLERVAPVPSTQLAPDGGPQLLEQQEPAPPQGAGAEAASPPKTREPAGSAGAHDEPAPAGEPSLTSPFSEEITAALLPAPDLSGLSEASQLAPFSPSAAASSSSSSLSSVSAASPAPGEEAALPLTARRTLHLQPLPAPFSGSPATEATPPQGLAGYAEGGAEAGAPTSPGVPRDVEATANLILPAALPQQLRLPPSPAEPGPVTRPGEVSLVRRAAGSLLANLGMGLLGGLLALLGAVGFLYVRGNGTTKPASASAGAQLDPAVRSRLLEQATQSLLAGRRQQALASLREYAAASPEPAIEEMIRLLEREP
jgi:hypothetical protein